MKLALCVTSNSVTGAECAVCGVASRDERRWIEKQNKAARQKRKKEEIARLRQLVGQSMLLSTGTPHMRKHTCKYT